jgi:hypothetical protein
MRRRERSGRSNAETRPLRPDRGSVGQHLAGDSTALNARAKKNPKPVAQEVQQKLPHPSGGRKGCRGKDRTWTISCSGSVGCVGLPEKKQGKTHRRKAALPPTLPEQTRTPPTQDRSKRERLRCKEHRQKYLKKQANRSNRSNRRKNQRKI